MTRYKITIAVIVVATALASATVLFEHTHVVHQATTIVNGVKLK